MTNQERLSWLHEGHFEERGQRAAAYVATNGPVAQSGTTVYDIWEPDLSTSAGAGLTQGTTLIGVANLDYLPPGAIHTYYPAAALNRPMIIDEVGARVQLSANTNFYNWQLQCNLLWIDQSSWVLADFAGTCYEYTAGNYQTSGAMILARRRWGPDRLYNAAVGIPEQPVSGSEYGPSARVIYANADAETCGLSCSRVLAPLITDSQAVAGVWRPPKDSVIIDPGQAIILNVYDFLIPPAAHLWDVNGDAATTVAAAGDLFIAAWIRFRQPIMNEPDTATNELVNGMPVY
jgi:hypothetical protein